MLQLRDKHNNTLVLELSGDGTYWNINTAGIFKTTYGADKEEIYNRHTMEKLPAEAIKTSQKPEPSCTTDLSRINVPKSPIDKVIESTREKQEVKAEGQAVIPIGEDGEPDYRLAMMPPQPSRP